ncbi:MAG: response regulator, partial [Chloroflexaceae bacterium]|nr:response regulator [Chloroflexaceae bacterium]
SNEAVAELWTPAHQGEAPSTDGPLLLLVEDNGLTIKMMREYLQTQGFQVQVAYNGQEALDMLELSRPALILMDIQMPVMDGLEAITHIRNNAVFRNVPIIALTALAMDGDSERCLAAGANSYLSKPVLLKELLALIRHYLNSNQ